MTQKEIIALATDQELMDILQDISDLQSNMVNQTIYEQKSAKREMKYLAKIIIDNLNAMQ